MNQPTQDPVKRWTAKRKTELAFDIIQGRITIPEASRSHDLTPSEIESWIEDGKKAFENAMRSKPLDTRQQHEKELREMQEAYGEAMLGLRARKKLQALLDAEKER